MTITLGAAYTGWTWTDYTPWIADPVVDVISTYNGGGIYYKGRNLAQCVLHGFAPRTQANASDMMTMGGTQVVLNDDSVSMSQRCRITGVSDAGSTAAYLFVALTLRVYRWRQ